MIQKNYIFSNKILLWYQSYGTKNLPWQLHKTMYTTWLSEVMLQQTQVKTVIVYYHRFVKIFPTIEQLASAELDEVLFLWSGLGYYARARNLHKTAKIVVERYYGDFPQNLDILASLPGIGRSTAGAILSLTLNQHYPILDSNIKRILIRYYALDYYLSGEKTKANNTLWSLSTQLLPVKQASNFNQAMMDLGRLICTNISPACSKCPIQENCQAFLTHTIYKYPKKRTQQKLLKKTIWLLLLIWENDLTRMVWLEKRLHQKIWGGLFCFPEFYNLDTLNAWLLHHNIHYNTCKNLSTIKHKLSSINLEIKPTLFNVNKKINYQKTGIWYNLNDPPNIGLPKPISTILKKIKNV